MPLLETISADLFSGLSQCCSNLPSSCSSDSAEQRPYSLCVGQSLESDRTVSAATSTGNRHKKTTSAAPADLCPAFRSYTERAIIRCSTFPRPGINPQVGIRSVHSVLSQSISSKVSPASAMLCNSSKLGIW